MAIDTANKRSSVAGELPFASGAISESDRPQTAGEYSGLSFLLPFKAWYAEFRARFHYGEYQ